VVRRRRIVHFDFLFQPGIADIDGPIARCGSDALAVGAECDSVYQHLMHADGSSISSIFRSRKLDRTIRLSGGYAFSIGPESILESVNDVIRLEGTGFAKVLEPDLLFGC